MRQSIVSLSTSVIGPTSVPRFTLQVSSERIEEHFNVFHHGSHLRSSNVFWCPDCVFLHGTNRHSWLSCLDRVRCRCRAGLHVGLGFDRRTAAAVRRSFRDSLRAIVHVGAVGMYRRPILPGRIDAIVAGRRCCSSFSLRVESFAPISLFLTRRCLWISFWP